MLDFQASRWLMQGEVAKQAGNNHPTSTEGAWTGAQRLTRRSQPSQCMRRDRARGRADTEAGLPSNGEIACPGAPRTSADGVDECNGAGVRGGPIIKSAHLRPPFT